MKAVIYARVSSTDDSQSYDRQIDNLKTFGNHKQLEIAEIFAEKVSAYRKSLDERLAFNSMIEYVNANKIKHILVTELSRISRKYIDTINFIHDCKLKGINVHIHKDGFSTLNDDGSENVMAQMMVGFLSSIAQKEAEDLSQRSRSGKIFSAKNGGGFNKKIYGYDKGEDGKPIINEEQAILIRKIFGMLVEGVGIRTIVNHLNSMNPSKEWKVGTVHGMVRNSFYCGKRKYKIDKLEQFIIDAPAIVSEKTFNDAQDFIDNRKRFAGRVGANVNPFASFIKCKCGATMNQIIIKSNNTDLYKCSKNCGINSVNRPYLIREVKAIVEKNARLTRDEFQRGLMSDKIKLNSNNILKNQTDIRKLKLMSDKNYERLLDEKIDEKKYDDFEAKFKLQITKLEKDTKELDKSNKALKTHLKGEILHYSDDLSVFKSQLLKSIDFIEIGKEIAVVKIKGWAKVVIYISRGGDLLRYNNYLKANGNSNGFLKLDWDKLPESTFDEEIGIE